MTALEEIQQDHLAMSIARSLAAANEAAASHGIDLANSLVTISEEFPPPVRLWRIQYGTREFTRRRGGDLIVIVDETTSAVQRIVHGQ